VCVTTPNFCDTYYRYPLMSVRDTARDSLCVMTYSAFRGVLQT
jgi:hypothetical protein